VSPSSWPWFVLLMLSPIQEHPLLVFLAPLVTMKNIVAVEEAILMAASLAIPDLAAVVLLLLVMLAHLPCTVPQHSVATAKHLPFRLESVRPISPFLPTPTSSFTNHIVLFYLVYR
jgi:hypothetical protein